MTKTAEIEVATIAGGMKVAVEPRAGAQVASIVWLIPAGTAGDPVGDAGAGESTLLHDVIMRGAGEYSSRDFSDALDRLGVQRGTSASPYHITISAVCLGNALEETLRLLSLMVTAPKIDQESLDASRELALQSLMSLQDDPQSFVGLRAAELAIQAPYNLSGHGTKAGLESLTCERLQATWKRRSRPGGAILGIAGQVDPAKVTDTLESILQGWRGESAEPPVSAAALRGKVHDKIDSSQTHMALVFDAPRACDKSQMAHSLVVRALGGGGMANRLFTEVREKRGLCYSVGMAYSAGRDRGLMQAYAGSTPERAPETLACMREVIVGMAQGLTQAEFDRGIVGFKSNVVMNGESTHARASAITGDMFRRGRPRTLEEVASEVDALTLEEVNLQAKEAFAPEVLAAQTLAVVGPAPLG